MATHTASRRIALHPFMVAGIAGRHKGLAAAVAGAAVLTLTPATPPMLGVDAFDTEPSAGSPTALTLTGDVTPHVQRLGDLVLATTRRHGLTPATTVVTIRWVDRVDPDRLVAGRTDGRTVEVGRNTAEPDRVLIHELAHALVGLEHAHGPTWRRVYLDALTDELGVRAAEREHERIRWIHDKRSLARPRVPEARAGDVDRARRAPGPSSRSGGRPAPRSHRDGVP